MEQVSIIVYLVSILVPELQHVFRVHQALIVQEMGIFSVLHALLVNSLLH